ncbi:unnamed protein product [Lactuca virosa]|uniref:PAZ domain-containing protein n=1 Tax=Lactuca virosa TaxID=75947 RepID=A0AAU9P9Q4_9ASTR|nr:unnamed protein product [Lactuca virosa]
MKSVVEYFQEMYGFTIRLTHLPCLQVGNQKKANYLPMEACKIVEGRRYTKRLNEKQITALLKVTCQRPKDRENDILQGFGVTSPKSRPEKTGFIYAFKIISYARVTICIYETTKNGVSIWVVLPFLLLPAVPNGPVLLYLYQIHSMSAHKDDVGRHLSQSEKQINLWNRKDDEQNDENGHFYQNHLDEN